MKSDIEIANECRLERIEKIAEKCGIATPDIYPYGHHIAKVPLKYINDEKVKKSNLILVTSISATKAGIGKTTTSISLSLGLNHIRHERWRSRRRLRTSAAHGENQPPLHR